MRSIVADVGFEWAYRNGAPPWDIGRPQPAIVRVAKSGAIRGAVLDAGCGTGENAMYIATLGAGVTGVIGVDASPTAIERARRKAIERGIDISFEVADATALEGLGREFDVVIDCGLFHTFGDAARVAFERSLRAVLRAGGRYFLLCFSDRQSGVAGPRRVSRAEIRSTFGPGWRVDSIEAERFETIDPGDGPDAWLASLTRL